MYSFEFSEGLSKEIEDLSLALGATLFMTLYAGFTCLLSRYSGQKDIVVGTPVAGRERPEIEGLIGLFANTLCLRTDLTDDPTFRELTTRVREEALLAFSQSDLPFERLVEELQPTRDRSYSPLFQVMFALQNLPARKLQLAGAEMEMIPAAQRASPFDLTLYVWEGDTQLQGAFEYNTDLFDESTIARMFRHYEVLLTNAIADPGQRISALQLLTGPEFIQATAVSNAKDAARSPHATLAEAIAKQAQRTPDAVAICCDGKSLTYQELDERSNRLARHLQSLGAGSDVLVGIALERSVEMVVALAGVLKAGAAYLPIDLTFPRDRLAYMLVDSQAALLITESGLLDRLPEHAARVVCIDSDWATIETESKAEHEN
jgi:non-ribosomal peptide synthetase component F